MAYKTFTTRFPIRKLHKKSVFKKKQVDQTARSRKASFRGRQAGRGQKGISRRER